VVNRARLVGPPHSLCNLVFYESETLRADNTYRSQAALDDTPTEIRLRLQKMATDKTPWPDSRHRVRLRPQARPTTPTRGPRASTVCCNADSRFQHRPIFKPILINTGSFTSTKSLTGYSKQRFEVGLFQNITRSKTLAFSSKREFAFSTFL
jgi:hypothetical protein